MDFFDFIKNGWDSFVEKLIDFLPKSPIVYLSYDNDFKNILGYVNWFIPIYTMISLAETWLTAVAIYYLVQVILRWAKIIE